MAGIGVDALVAEHFAKRQGGSAAGAGNAPGDFGVDALVAKHFAQRQQPQQGAGEAAFRKAMGGWQERSLGFAKDQAINFLGHGGIDLVETGIGLADLATLPQRTLKARVLRSVGADNWADITEAGLARNLERTGYWRPEEGREILTGLQSEKKQAADRAWAQAQKQAQAQNLGVIDAGKLYLQTIADNPDIAFSGAVSSLPSMAAGGVAGRAANVAGKAINNPAARAAVGRWAGAIGEGTVGAGSAAEQIRQESPDRVLTGRGAVAALGTGATTAVLGRFGNVAGEKIGARLGATIADVDNLLVHGFFGEAARAASPAARKSFAGAVARAVGSVAGGAVQEGLLEELPQSATEQMWQNWAHGKDLWEGVLPAAVMGAATGAAMGGGANILSQGASAMRGTAPGAAPGTTPPSDKQKNPHTLDFGGRDVDTLAGEYAAMEGTDGGRLIDVDRIRELSPEYRADRSRAADIHEAASSLSQQLFERALAQPVGDGRDEVVVFTAGGGGSGKSSAINRMFGESSADVTLDGTFSNQDKASARVQAALDSGRDAEIRYVYRSPEKAAQGAIQRAIASGRPVPTSALAKAHAQSLQTVRAIAEQFKDDPRVSVIAIDNNGDTLDDARVTDISNIPEVSYDDAKRTFDAAVDAEWEAAHGGRSKQDTGEAPQQTNADARRASADESAARLGRPTVSGSAQSGSARGHSNALTPALYKAFTGHEPPARAAEAAAPQTAARGSAAPAQQQGQGGRRGFDLDAYQAKMRRRESGGKANAYNPASGALGLDQFIPSTWRAYVRRLQPAWAEGKSDAEILAMRADPAKTTEIRRAFDKDNMLALRRAGLPVNEVTMYALHHFGPGGGVKFLKAAPDTPTSALFSKAVLAANPYLQGKTQAQVLANFRKSGLSEGNGGSGAQAAPQGTEAGAAPQAEQGAEEAAQQEAALQQAQAQLGQALQQAAEQDALAAQQRALQQQAEAAQQQAAPKSAEQMGEEAANAVLDALGVRRLPAAFIGGSNVDTARATVANT